MQANWREIAKAFSENQNYVLATIIETRGATYQKAGAMMLINQKVECFGLLSGGCLEADISLHAKQVLLNKKSTIIRYDLNSDADLLWGLGLGCDGAIDILLQPLLIANNHLGFKELLASLASQKSGYYLQSLPIHTLNSNELTTQLPATKPHASFKINQCIKNADFSIVAAQLDGLKYQLKNKEQYYFVTPVSPPLSLLICGAGPDVVPVTTFAEQMGWQVTLWDHRNNHLQEPSFSRFNRRCIRAKDTKVEEYNCFDAVIVMTHNLTMDKDYLLKLHTTSETKLRYIGILGPKSRRDKLLSLCELEPSQIQHRIHGPIGLNLGGRGAEAIALSVISEIQQYFYRYLSTKQTSEKSFICISNEDEIQGLTAQKNNEGVLSDG